MKYKLLILIILFMTAILPVFSQEAVSLKENNVEYATGKIIKVVTEVQNKMLQSTMGGTQTVQLVQVKILNGKNKGKTVVIENQLTSNPAYDIKVHKGDRVILDVEKNGGNLIVNISDRERMPALMIVTGLFFTLLLAIGGMKGLKSMVSLGITGFLIFFVFVPAILNNYPIIPVTMLVALASTLVTMFIVGGINVKSISACIGTIGGVIFAGLISALIIKIAPLSGLTDQEALMLWTARPDLDFTGILTSAMIIGSLGAIIDVGMSIASSIAEIKTIDESLTTAQLINSGLNVGKDIMGAMANTLILAYIGSALPLILLAANAPIIKLLNLNSIVTEIVAAIIGSIGIVLCVPITAVVSGYLMGRPKSEKKPIFSELKQNNNLLDIQESAEN